MEASKQIDQLIAGLKDWRAKTMIAVRKAIHKAEPKVVEEWKYMGSPVFYCDGMICVLNAHKDWVRLTFAKGAHLPDPKGIFNAELEGSTRRAIKYLENDKVDERSLGQLVKAAVLLNQAKPAGKKR